MAKQSKFWYVIVFTEEGAKYVTGLGEGKYAEWTAKGKPYKLSEAMAKDIAIGLMWNGYNANVVCSPIELDYQPYHYENGHFEWKDGADND